MRKKEEIYHTNNKVTMTMSCCTSSEQGSTKTMVKSEWWKHSIAPYVTL